MTSHSTKHNLHFIIGIGRSGTTILSKSLNKYSEIHCLPEANFLLFFLCHFKNKTNFSTNDIEDIFKQICLYSKSHPWAGWEFNAEQTRVAILKKMSVSNDMTYQEICKVIYTQFKVIGIDKSNAKILLDKNPSYTIFSNKISKTSPESKFIWIIRDYRSNILSRKQNLVLKHPPDIAYNAIRWKLYNKDANAFHKEKSDKVILIKYEDLISNNFEVSNKLNEFLEINSNMLETDFEEKLKVNTTNFDIPNEYTERFSKKYTDLNKTLNTERLDAWKEQLSANEIKICEAICSNFGKEMGYNSFINISKFEKIKIIVHHLPSIIKGYIDVYKDKILYYAPIKIKLNRLKKKYIELKLI